MMGAVPKTLPALPVECMVSVTIEAHCTIDGCIWAWVDCSDYTRTPTVKKAYYDHVRKEHPGYTVTPRTPVSATDRQRERVVRDLAGIVA